MTANDLQIKRYKRMCEMRAFEETCLEALKRQAIHGELHVGIGQEAISAGMAECLRTEDAVVTTHRNHLHALAKGVDPHALLAEICEREAGLCRGRGGHMHPFDSSTNFSATGIVGASVPVALGYAHAFRMRRQDAVAVGITGDGGSHTGGFHESLVMAGAARLPLVVLVENNSLAISVNFDDVSPTKTVAERAVAYSARGIHVDGTDPDLVADAFADAMNHARSGKGPVIIEATCHRFRGHFEGDGEEYRARETRDHIRKTYDPLTLYARKLGQGAAAELSEVRDRATEAAKALLMDVLSLPMPAASGALDYVFAGEALP